MLYEETTSPPPKASKDDVFNILERMKEATSKGVEDQATVLFADLVSALKTLDTRDMVNVISNSQKPERYYLKIAFTILYIIVC